MPKLDAVEKFDEISSADDERQVALAGFAVVESAEIAEAGVIKDITLKNPSVARTIFALHQVDACVEASPVSSESDGCALIHINLIKATIRSHQRHHQLHFTWTSGDADFDFVLCSSHNGSFSNELKGLDAEPKHCLILHLSVQRTT